MKPNFSDVTVNFVLNIDVEEGVVCVCCVLCVCVVCVCVENRTTVVTYLLTYLFTYLLTYSMVQSPS